MSDAAPTRAEGDRPSRLSRLVSIGVVLATLTGATAGFLEVRANRRSDDASQRGLQLAVQSMSTLLKTNQAAQTDFDNFRRAQDLRARAGSTLQQLLFAGDALRFALELKQQRLLLAAEATQALTPLTRNGPDGPRADPRFPSSFFARRTGDALRLQALQDAANQEKAGWEAQASGFTAVLTLLAVVVYLFGFALALPDRVMRVFGAAGTVLFVAALAFGVRTALAAPEAVPESAAAEFAAGFVGLETAVDRAGFEEARDHFSAAIEQWPSFGRAHATRGLATLRAESPKLNDILMPPEALQSAITDLERARDLGMDNASIALQLAAANYGLGLQGRPDLLERAETYALEAIELLPDDPIPRYARAFSLLARGQDEAAGEALRDAVSRSLVADAAGTARNPAFVQLYVSGALTDLEALAKAMPDRAAQVLRAKEIVVGSAAAGEFVVPEDGTQFPELQVLVTASTLSWVAAGEPDVDPTTDLVSAQWLEQRPDGSWVGMPEVSGSLDFAANPELPRQEGRNILAASIPPRCLGSGRYRVELYVNGHLAGTGEAQFTSRPLTAFLDRVLNLTFCHPPDWQLSPATLEGFRNALVSPDGGQGAALVRYNLSGLPPRLRNLEPGELTASLIETTVASLGGVLPAEVTGSTPVTHERFIWPEGPSQQSFTFGDGGLAFVQAGVDSGDDAAFVTVVFGPQELFSPTAPPEQSLLVVATSFSEYRYGGSF